MVKNLLGIDYNSIIKTKLKMYFDNSF